MDAEIIQGHIDNIRSLLVHFESDFQNEDLRVQVLELVPVMLELRDLGSSLISNDLAQSATDRILFYFQKYPQLIIAGNELCVVAGIQEWARRVRELRRQQGWNIIAGLTAKEMVMEGDLLEVLNGQDLRTMVVDDYLLLSTIQDRDAAFRWELANRIRRKKIAVKTKILEFLKENVGRPVTGEELKYLAKDRSEWARRTRELRTEEGWPVKTKQTGRPDLPVGIYLLEAARQTPPHDRKIKDAVRLEVLERDKYKCTNCGWNRSRWTPEVPRFLELHHVIAHVNLGDNEAENLITLCNVCHDDIHRE